MDHCSELVRTGYVAYQRPSLRPPQRRCVRIGAYWSLLPDDTLVPETRAEALALTRDTAFTDLLPANWVEVAVFADPRIPERALEVQHSGRTDYLLVPDVCVYSPGMSFRELAACGCVRVDRLPRGVAVVGKMVSGQCPVISEEASDE